MKKTVWKLQNKDKIDVSHRSQLKFEFHIHLLNYTIKIKTLKNINWAFQVLGFNNPKN